MPRNFNVWPPNNPRAVIRLIMGMLLAANLVAAYFVIRPIGGSPQQLREQATEMRARIAAATGRARSDATYWRARSRAAAPKAISS